jgi:Bacterial regulatory protein, Fis family
VHLNPGATHSSPAKDEGVGGNFRAVRARAIEAFEREYVIDLLRAHQGNITQAARTAGQDRRAFGRLVKRHNIRREALSLKRKASGVAGREVVVPPRIYFHPVRFLKTGSWAN